jgi:hypothetical protein
MESLAPGLNSLADYPRWLVVACASIAAALLIYLLAKLLKWGLYLLLVLVLVGGLGLALWLALK